MHILKNYLFLTVGNTFLQKQLTLVCDYKPFVQKPPAQRSL